MASWLVVLLATAALPIAAADVHSSGFSGKVVEAIVTGGYVYVQVDSAGQKLWAAAPEQKVEVGDRVTVPAGLPMSNHYSKTLDRTFETVYFVESIAVQGAPGVAPPSPGAASSGLPPGHPVLPTSKQASPVDFSGIEKPEGGMTVAEIFEQRASLASQEVLVRGRVVKFTPNVMGKNWIHLRDGTVSASGENDLTVTTGTNAAVGDTVLVRGVLAIDRDFGFGYRYDALIEDATATVE